MCVTRLIMWHYSCNCHISCMWLLLTLFSTTIITTVDTSPTIRVILIMPPSPLTRKIFNKSCFQPLNFIPITYWFAWFLTCFNIQLILYLIINSNPINCNFQHVDKSKMVKNNAPYYWSQSTILIYSLTH